MPKCQKLPRREYSEKVLVILVRDRSQPRCERAGLLGELKADAAPISRGAHAANEPFRFQTINEPCQRAGVNINKPREFGWSGRLAAIKRD
jgi:hypothetical protein